MITPVIPPRFHDAVREQRADGQTTRQIACWLWTAHRIKASRSSVARFLRKERATREPLARDILRDELRTSITADFRRAEQIWDGFTQQEEELAALETPEVRESPLLMMRLVKMKCDLLEQKSRFLWRRAAMAGLTEPAEQDVTSFIQRLLHGPSEAPPKDEPEE